MDYATTVDYRPDVFLDYKGYFINDINDFKFKGKTKDPDRKNIALAKFLFNKYKTPKFMDKIWYYAHKTYGHKRIDERLLYVCIATGGSLYKEYFKGFYTKNETHAFLNCRHDELDVRQAQIYAVALCESGNERNALQLAKSKILITYSDNKELIKTAIQTLVLAIDKNDVKIQSGLAQAYVYLAQFIDDERAEVAERGRTILEKEAPEQKEEDTENLEMANQAVQTINSIKSDMENLMNEIRLLTP